LWTIDLLEVVGPELREPYTKPLAGKLWELRAKSIRIFYFLYRRNIILLHGYRKTTQKTPKSEIELALKLMGDYMRRETK